jgi:hypothetical protein
MSQHQHGIKLIDTIRKFLYPIGTFRDASRGSFLERAAAYRHNRAARGCLPQYMRNWLFVAMLLSCVGAGLENAHNLAAAILCWILVTYTITELAVLSAIYLVLSTWEY